VERVVEFSRKDVFACSQASKPEFPTQITRKGIEGTRIKALGVGESQPVARNSNPDGSDSPGGRKLNRRVEIRIAKPELPNIVVEGVKVPDNLKK
jgi:hypothetical protein